MKKKTVLIAITAMLLVICSIFTMRAVSTHNSNPMLDANTEALSRFEFPYRNAENYLFEDGRLCCKNVDNRWCTIGYFCNEE